METNVDNGAPQGVSEEQPAPNPGVAEDESTVTDPAAQLAAVTAERDRLAAENAGLLDRLLRRQAEFENFRRRSARERAEVLEFAGMEAVRDLLPILDDFERALKVECADAEYAKGMGLIYQRFLESLKKLGLEPIESEGAPFDPNLHHAVETVESEEAEQQTVAAELQKGYNFRGRLLRPSMVKVAVSPQPKS